MSKLEVIGRSVRRVRLWVGLVLLILSASPLVGPTATATNTNQTAINFPHIDFQTISTTPPIVRAGEQTELFVTLAHLNGGELLGGRLLLTIDTGGSFVDGDARVAELSIPLAQLDANASQEVRATVEMDNAATEHGLVSLRVIDDGGNAIALGYYTVYLEATSAEMEDSAEAAASNPQADRQITTPPEAGKSSSAQQPKSWTLNTLVPRPSLFSGAATYGYGFEVPPARGGVGPNMGLSYNSRISDARRYPHESGKYGEGWSLGGFPSIAFKEIKGCDGTGGICLSYNQYVLNMGGTHDLIRESCAGLTCTYQVRNNPSLKVIHHRPSTNTAPALFQEEYWELYTADGLIYKFGQHEDSQQFMSYIDRSPHIGTYKWFIDEMSDAFGNQMIVIYQDEEVKPQGDSTREASFHDQNGNWEKGCYEADANGNYVSSNHYWCREVDIFPKLVRYNPSVAQPGRLNANDWESEVEFVWGGRNVFSNNSDHSQPIFARGAHLAQIDMRQAGADGGAKENVWSYKLTIANGDYGAFPCYIEEACRNGTRTSVLKSIQRIEGAHELPATEFEYYGEDEAANDAHFVGEHFYVWTAPPSNDPPGVNCTNMWFQWQCWKWIPVKMPHLKLVKNGYGAVHYFEYATLPWPDGEWTDVKSWVVSAMYTWDGAATQYNGSLDGYTAKQIYRYDTPCRAIRGSGCYFDQQEGSKILVGAERVTIETFDADNNALAKRQLVFHLGNEELLGKIKYDYQLNPQTGEQLNSTHYSWMVSNYGNPRCGNHGLRFYAVCLVEAKSTQHSGAMSPIEQVNQQLYYYDSSYQGGRQWGQQTNVKHYVNGEFQGERFAYYVANSAEWIVRPWFSGKLDNRQQLLNGTLMLYGNATYPAAQQPQRGDQPTQISTIVDLDAFHQMSEDSTTIDTIDLVTSYNSAGLPIETTTFTKRGAIHFPTGVTQPEQWAVARRSADEEDSLRTTVAYNAQQMPQTVTNVLGIQQSITYGQAAAAYPWQVTAQTTRYGVGAKDIWQTQYAYDALGRLSTIDANVESDLALQIDTAYAYHLGNPNDGADNLTVAQFTFPDAVDESVKSTVTTEYDGLNRPIVTRQYNVPSDTDASVYSDYVSVVAYDALGRVVCQSEPTIVAVGASAPACETLNHTSIAYNMADRSQTVTTPDQLVTTQRPILNTADADWLPYNTADATTQTVVQIRSQSGQLLRETIQATNPLGQTVWIAEYDDSYPSTTSCAEWYVLTEYAYDEQLGTMTQVTRGRAICQENGAIERAAELGVTTIKYDAIGRKIAMSDPDMGEWAYEYDEQGNLVRQVGGDNAITCAAYDKFGRLILQYLGNVDGCPDASTLNNTDDAFVARYRYHPYGTSAAGQIASIIYNPQLQAVGIGGEFSDMYQYDDRGRMTAITRHINGRAFTEHVLTFDLLNRPVTVQNPAGENVTTTYDRWGADSLQIDNGRYTNQDLVRYTAHNERGQVHAMGRGNDVDSFYHYDGIEHGYRLSNVVVQDKTGQTVAAADYTYDPLGQIANLTTRINGPAQTLLETEHFTYDSLGRLQTAQAATGAEVAYSFGYEYDLFGSLAQVNSYHSDYASTTYHAVETSGSPMPKHAVGAMQTGSQTYSYEYDQRGNMTTRESAQGTFEHTFDELGRLTEVTHAESGDTTHFAYDTGGIRVLTLEPDGTLLYTPFPSYQLETALTDAPQIMSFTANNQLYLQVAPDTPFTLNWTALNAVGCQLEGADANNHHVTRSFEGASGELAMDGFGSGARQYTLRCHDGRVSSLPRSVTIIVDPDPAIVKFEVRDINDTLVTSSLAPTVSRPVSWMSPLTLSWESVNAASCSAHDDWTKERGTVGSQSITMDWFGTRSFELRCTSHVGGSVNSRLTISTLLSGNLSARHSGRCVSVLGLSNEIAAPILQWNCGDIGNQGWSFIERRPAQYAIMNQYSGLCLDANPNSTAVYQNKCHYQNNQLWRVELTENGYFKLRNVRTNSCLDVHGAATTNVVLVKHWRCTNGHNQQFKLDLLHSVGADHEISLQARHSNRCVDVSGMNPRHGANIHQWDCNWGANQKWVFVERGKWQYAIVAKHSGKCIDASASGNVYQGTCHYRRNQLWRLVLTNSGYFRLQNIETNKCLEVTHQSRSNGGNLVQTPCHIWAHQEFRLIEQFAWPVWQSEVGGGVLTTDMGRFSDKSFTTYPTANVPEIERITYSMSGMAIATAVTGHADEETNGLFYTHGNHLGSISFVTYGDSEKSGQIVPETVARHLPFGGYRNELATSETLEAITDKGFTGHRENRDIGLTYMNARYYAPELRRFVSADTIIPDPLSSTGWNRFAYVSNNPINFIDPTGHCQDAAGYYDTNKGEWIPGERDEECWDEYESLLEAGAPPELLGSGDEYEQRDDVEIIIGLHQEWAMGWDILLSNQWGTWGGGDVTTVCTSGHCNIGYTYVTVSGQKVCLMDGDVCATGGRLYMIFNTEGLINTNGMVVTESAAQEFISYVDAANRNRHRRDAAFAAGTAALAACEQGHLNDCKAAYGFFTVAVQQEAERKLNVNSAKIVFNDLWNATHNLSVMSRPLSRFRIIYDCSQVENGRLCPASGIDPIY